MCFQQKQQNAAQVSCACGNGKNSITPRKVALAPTLGT